MNLRNLSEYISPDCGINNQFQFHHSHRLLQVKNLGRKDQIPLARPIQMIPALSVSVHMAI